MFNHVEPNLKTYWRHFLLTQPPHLAARPCLIWKIASASLQVVKGPWVRERPDRNSEGHAQVDIQIYMIDCPVYSPFSKRDYRLRDHLCA